MSHLGETSTCRGRRYLASRPTNRPSAALKVAGEEAVCLGGARPASVRMRDVTWKLTAVLLGRGHPARGSSGSLGLNLRRFLSEVLGDLERRSAGRHALAGGPEPPRAG